MTRAQDFLLEVGRQREEIGRLRAALREKDGRIAALEEALRPLAAARHTIDRYSDTNGEPSDWTAWCVLRVGDIDRATALLATATPPDAPKEEE